MNHTAAFLPTPTESGLPLRAGDFATMLDALDYAAGGRTGMNFHSVKGELVTAPDLRTALPRRARPGRPPARSRVSAGRPRRPGGRNLARFRHRLFCLPVCRAGAGAHPAAHRLRRTRSLSGAHAAFCAADARRLPPGAGVADRVARTAAGGDRPAPVLHRSLPRGSRCDPASAARDRPERHRLPAILLGEYPISARRDRGPSCRDGQCRRPAAPRPGGAAGRSGDILVATLSRHGARRFPDQPDGGPDHRGPARHPRISRAGRCCGSR